MRLITKEVLLSHLSRAEMASEVTLPIDFFRDLLYQAMPKEWVGLTDEEIDGLVKNTQWHELIKATEVKLKAKNFA
jgi:hypothetical protein